MILVLPIGGKSSRFSTERPKWSLTCPNGMSMLEMSCVGLSSYKFSKCIVVNLLKNKNLLGGNAEIKRRLKKILKCPIDILSIKSSNSQGETVNHAVNYMINKNYNEPFFIKDCDSFFKIKDLEPNPICAFEIKKDYSGPLANKSFISKNGLGILNNIREKEITSNIISVGGYSFKSPLEYTAAYNKLSKNINIEKEIYISDIINIIMIDSIFQVEMVDDFIDCGTQEMWEQFKSQFKTMFIDIDGVLVYSNTKNGVKTNKIITDNLKTLLELQNKKSLQIILTTARDKNEAELIVKELEICGLIIHSVIHGLYHAKRTLINDFTSTNSFPTAIAINFPRDNNNLHEYI